MGLLSRMSSILKAKMSAALDRAEDPAQTLDYSYEKQLELLRNVKRGVVEVVTSKRRLQLQAAGLQENLAKLEDQARRALGAGREDLARMALEHKQVIVQQLQGLEGQIEDLEKEQEKLSTAETRLSAKVEAFRTHKEVIKAQYSSAAAQVKIGEAVTGLSEEMADVGLAVDRAEEKTQKMRARASAIDELVDAGTLEDFSGRPDAVERQLAQISVSQGVEDELAEMKRQIEGPKEPKQLEEGK
ncbi:MAG: PspA/IM30 family protein [Deltaproteobacteria bacterium]|jgi:phage shock protein A|nr:PspA/IM30 family protein [Deltaproteobacteria bacterium]